MNISSNIQSIANQKQISQAQKSLATSITKASEALSKKIESMRHPTFTPQQKQIAAISEMRKNTQDTISVLQTASGGLSQSTDSLLRMRELASAAKTNSLDDTQKAAIQQEFDNHLQHLDSIASSTSYSSHQVLDGSLDLVTISSEGKDRSIAIGNMSSEALGLKGASILDADSADKAFSQINSALDTVSNQQRSLDEEMSVVDSHYQDLQAKLALGANTPARSRIEDFDFEKEWAEAEARSAALRERLLASHKEMSDRLHTLSSVNVFKLLQ